MKISANYRAVLTKNRIYSGINKTARQVNENVMILVLFGRQT